MPEAAALNCYRVILPPLRQNKSAGIVVLNSQGLLLFHFLTPEWVLPLLRLVISWYQQTIPKFYSSQTLVQGQSYNKDG